MAVGVLPKNKETIAPAAEQTPQPPPKEESIKKAESKILEPKYDSAHICAYDKCPITKKQILFGMHCVFYKDKTYHASCAKSYSLVFKIQQPPQRPKEAST